MVLHRCRNVQQRRAGCSVTMIGRPADQRPALLDVGTFFADPETTVPGTVIAWMSPRPLFVDVFRIDVATGATTPLVERTDPADTFFVDRTGRATWHMAKDADGTYEISAADPATGELRLLHR